MGRPKQFDRETVIAKATLLFQTNGYTATSTQQLVEALGINRKSLYAEFGSKQGVFEAVLDRYDRTTVSANFGPLEAESAGLAEIEEVVRMFARGSRTGSGYGCLLCNTAVERAANDAQTMPFVEHYFDRMTAAFQNAFDMCARRCEISADADLVGQSQYLTTAVLGLAVLVRAKAPPAVAEAAAEVVVAHVRALAKS